MLFLAAAACLPLAGCRTEAGGGVTETWEMFGGGNGRAGGGDGSKKPAAAKDGKESTKGVPASAAAADGRGGKPGATATAADGMERKASPATKAADGAMSVKTTGSAGTESRATAMKGGVGLPDPKDRPSGSKAAGAARLPAADASDLGDPAKMRAGLPSAGEPTPPTRTEPASLAVGAPSDPAARPRSGNLTLPSGADPAGPARTGGVRIGLPGAEPAKDAPRKTAGGLTVSVPEGPEKSRGPTGSLALGAGAAPAARVASKAAAKLAVANDAPADRKAAPSVNRVAQPRGDGAEKGPGEARPLPEGVAGSGPREERKPPVPFRLSDWLSSDGKRGQGQEPARKDGAGK